MPFKLLFFHLVCSRVIFSPCVFFFFLFIVVHTSMGNYYTAKWLAVKKNRNCIFLMHMKHTIHSHVFVTIINALIKWIFIVQTVFIFALCHSFSTAQSGIHARALFALLLFFADVYYLYSFSIHGLLFSVVCHECKCLYICICVEYFWMVCHLLPPTATFDFFFILRFISIRKYSLRGGRLLAQNRLFAKYYAFNWWNMFFTRSRNFSNAKISSDF